MKNRKKIVTLLFMGVLASTTVLNIFGGYTPGTIPSVVHAQEIGTDEEVYSASQGSFADVEAGKYYYRPVYWAVENNVTNGTGTAIFSPDNHCSRSQTVTFLWRIAGEPEPDSLDTGFADVVSDSFYEKAVAWAVENGITKGKNSSSFDPEGICSRSEFVTFLHRAAGTPDPHGSGGGFGDVVSGSFYEKAVIWAVENGVTTGTGANSFSPGKICTRAEVVTFLHRWRTTLNVQECGANPNDGVDDTDAINSAIDRVVDDDSLETVYLPAGIYVVNAEPGIKMKSNTSLLMASNAVLDVRGNSQERYNVIRARDSENISISGGQIRGERDKHTGSGGEWGMGIGLYDCRNVTISNVKISKNWGDGIYVGSTNDFGDDLYGCDTIRIENCEIFENRRSNISIVNADNVTIDNCKISNAGGAAPQCGINIEANTDDNGMVPDEAICRNIRITNTTVDVLGKDDANGQFFCFRTQRYRDRSIYTADNVIIENCTFNGDCGNYSGNNMTISNTVIRGCFYDMQNTDTSNNVFCDSTYIF